MTEETREWISMTAPQYAGEPWDPEVHGKFLTPEQEKTNDDFTIEVRQGYASGGRAYQISPSSDEIFNFSYSSKMIGMGFAEADWDAVDRRMGRAISAFLSEYERED